MNRDRDELSGVETTGHSWDGIKELNNPLPRWWLWTFLVTIVWGMGYVVVYPAWPLINSATTGTFGWSSRGDLSRDMNEADAAKASYRDRVAQMPVRGISADADLRAFATSAGASLYKVNCLQCHGSGAQGAAGYPNLNDDSWIWGGTLEQIEQTIAYGIRNTKNDEARVSEMPAFGRDNILNGEQISQVTEYVLSLAQLEHDDEKSKLGVVVYAENCEACHGNVGQGNIEFGAPQLNDKIWLIGGTREDIARQVRTPRHGMMPGWIDRLGPAQVKELTVYIHSLGGGQ